MIRRSTAPILASVLVALVVCAQARTLPGTPESDKALNLCKSADRVTGSEKLLLLDRGLALAEHAVAVDDADAEGHFAVFCNLGREMQLRPLSLGSLGAVRRLRREIERALDLAPDTTQVLVAKAMFLLELPRFLGGDPIEAERLLHRAVELDPAYASAHFALARLFMTRNERDAAAAQVQAALSATGDGLSSSETVEAHTLLASIEP